VFGVGWPGSYLLVRRLRRSVVAPKVSIRTDDGSGICPKVTGEKLVERKDHATTSGLWLSSSYKKLISNVPALKSH